MFTSNTQFSLRWNNYSHFITNAFDHLRNADDLIDVTLCCDGRKIRAHKMLLSACSTYFKDIFKENPAQHPVIIFKNVKFDDLWAIIQFMYQGEVNVQQELLPSFLNTAEMLCVQGLTDSNNASSSNNVNSNVDDTLPLPLPPLIKTNSSSSNSNETKSLQMNVESKPNLFAIMTNTNNLTTASNNDLLSTTHAITSTANKIRLTSNNDVNMATSFSSSLPTKRITTAPASTTAATARQILKEKPQFITQTSSSDINNEISFIENDVTEDCNETTEYLKMEAPDYTDIDASTTTHLQDPLPDNLNPIEQQLKQQPQQIEIDDDEEDDEDHNAVKYTVMETTDDGDMQVIYQNPTEGADESEFSSIEMNKLFVQSQPTDTSSPNKTGNAADVPTSKWSQCKFCKLVITTVNLWRHIRTQHTAQPPRQCEHCQKKFKNKYSLREHVRIAHEQKITLQIKQQND